MKFSTACIALLSLQTASAGIIDSIRNLASNGDAAAAVPANIEADADDKDRATGRMRSRKLKTSINLAYAKPTQTFFIPLPEADVFFNAFRRISPGTDSSGAMNVRGRVVSLVSVAISTDDTVIYYDHWEDGYEIDPTNPRSQNSGIWGDGNSTNGCRPDVAFTRTCTDADDILSAGDSFVIESKITVPRDSSNWFVSTGGIKIDGGDRLQVNFPVTITRGEYAEFPGSLLAGGVEVHEISKWGTAYEAPVGNDFIVATQAFEYVRFFIMSGEDENIVTFQNGLKRKMRMGESISMDVKMGDKVTSTKPIQVDILTGDPGSNYEMRWFSLLPTTSWSDSYVQAVGDSFARTKVLLYNPSDKTITATVRTLDSNGAPKSAVVTLHSKKSTYTDTIITGSGALIESPGNIMCALSVTDTETHTDHFSGIGLEQLNGQAFDWGYPLQPTGNLTSQVLVGWGYGCTANDCQGKTERSAVFVAPVKDADIYIDYQNTGSNPQKIFAKALQSVKIRDTKDQDMSGAIIFAVEKDTGVDGVPVNFASAWGQDPSVSRLDQQISLDLGTAVLPFPTVRANMVVDKKEAAPGDILTYTISILNVGQSIVPKGTYHIVDPLPPASEYIKGSLQYSSDGGQTFVAIDVSRMDVGKTPFPMDEAGLASLDILPRRGGLHQFRYQLRVVTREVSSLQFINSGFVKRPYGSDVWFEATTDLFFDPVITVDNRVYIGESAAVGCSGATESVTGLTSTGVTYCFTVKNNGATTIDSVTFSNTELSIAAGALPVGKLNPGESKVLTFQSKIMKSMNNTAIVEGTPVYTNGSPIPGKPKARATDPSGVLMTLFAPAIKVDNTVYKGLNGIAGCSKGVEKVVAAVGSTVTHCFTITNTGNTFLSNVKVSNKDISFAQNVMNLAPGGSATVSAPGKITGDTVNVATAEGTPSMSDGSPIASLAPVTHTDPAELGQADVRSGTKDRPIMCMQNAWEDDGNAAKLICRSKEVYLSKWINPPSLTCNEGETITISLQGLVNFISDRSDPGWYVAKDGGDALTGTCSAQAFLHDKKYTGAAITFKDGDTCGDVAVGAAGGAVEVPFIENQTIKCVDANNDYNLDFSVCFSWRTDKTDGKCAITRPDSEGLEIDLFPASTDKCFCTRYDVDTIKVVKPKANDAVSMC